MWSKVEEYIKKHKLLEINNLYLVALSGGADSVALLLLLKNGGFNVHAAHCNFHLRGDESDRDEAFCVSLCERLGVKLHRVHFDTRTYAEVHQVSIEMAARKLRYRWFAQLCQDIGAAGVCVAHHRDDSVETVLLNLVRGTGLRGLTGILPQTFLGNSPRLSVLRPLLCVSRAEIETFLAERGQEYVTDSTNLEAEVLRNKVRLEVLPLLKTLNPAVVRNIQKTAENLAEAQKVLDAVMEKYRDCKELDLNELKEYGSSEYIVFEWAKNYGFNGSQIRQLLSSQETVDNLEGGLKCGRMFTSFMGYDLLLDRGRLIVEPSLKPMKALLIPEEGTYVHDVWKIQVRRLHVANGAFEASKVPHIATLDAAKVVFPLTVRRVEKGDWMQPYGMRGRKLLSDLMTDKKYSFFEKRRQLVVVDAQGVIVWVVGLRTDQRVAVTEATRVVLMIKVDK